MRLDLAASFDFEPNSFSPPNSIPISKNNEIAANLESLSVERIDSWGWLEGLNKSRGRVGKLPVLCLESFPISLDMGSSRFQSGTFQGKESEFLKMSSFASRIGFEPNGAMTKFAGERGIKGLKRWFDLVDQGLENRDEYFQLINVHWERNQTGIDSKLLNFTLEELLAHELAVIKKEAEVHLAQNSSRLILPIPFSFKYNSKSRVKRAASLAGFSNVDFIPQNKALAQYYFCNNHIRQRKAQTIFISMGQCYTDIALCQSIDQKLEIVSYLGLNFGGGDFTKSLFNHIVGTLVNQELSLELQRQLFNECELVKCDLATSQSSKISFFGNTISITRDNYYKVTSHLIEELTESIKQCLKGPLESMQVVLFGGPFQQKRMVQKISDVFPGSDVHIITDPAAIVNGAAQQFSVDFRHRIPIHLNLQNYHYGVQCTDFFQPILLPDQNSNFAHFGVIPGSKAAIFSIYEGNYRKKDFNSLIAVAYIDSIPFMEYVDFKVEITMSPSGEVHVCLYPPLQKIIVTYLNISHHLLHSTASSCLVSFEGNPSTGSMLLAPKRMAFSHYSIDFYFNMLCGIQSLETTLVCKHVSKILFANISSHLHLLEQYLQGTLTEIKALNNHEHKNFEDNSSYMYVANQILSLLSSSSFEKFPQSAAKALISNLNVQIKVIQCWTQFPSPVEIEIDSDLNPHEKQSFEKLQELNRKIVIYTSEEHFRVAEIEIVLSEENEILPQSNKELALYIDTLERLLLKLDAIEVFNQSPLKQYRKSIIHFCQACLVQFDWLKKLYLHSLQTK